ncbi:hypothetical protein ZWY2020_029401 [Hordeum vulgare]|nr:hypothetical protein ZWY2020_029401 [Hordeum vulgare]
MASTHSARLSGSRMLPDGPVPTIVEKVDICVASRDFSQGMNPPSPSPSFSGSRFVILGSVLLSHIGDVDSDCDIVFRSEKGPFLEQILAICVKERPNGALAKACAQAEQRSDNGRNVNAVGHSDPLVNPSYDHCAHKESRVVDRSCNTGVSHVAYGDPALGRVLRGRPPTCLHPTK